MLLSAADFRVRGIHLLHDSAPAHRSTMTIDLVGLEFNKPVNTIKVMLSLSVYLTMLFLGRLSRLSGKPVPVHILLSETDKNCPS